MSEKDQVVKILRKAISPPFKATMGDGAGNVVVDGRPGYTWCRKLGRSEMLMQAYNRGAPTIEGIIVLVQESRVEHLGYEIIGVSSGGSPDNIYPPLPPHAWTHEWRPGIGRDRVTVYPRAWGYLRAEPIVTGSMNVWVTPGWYYHDGEYHWYPGGYSPGFGAPTGSTWYQTLYMDPSDETLHIVDGVTGGYGYAIPPSPPDCMLGIAAIESTGTFGTVTENMIEDIRLFMDPIAECGGLIEHGHSGTASGGLLDHGLCHTPASLLDDDHTQYFLADCTRAFGGDPIPDGADTRSLGSTTAEWLNLYMGEAGKIYFRLDQSVNLYSSAAGVLKTDDDFHCASEIYVGDGLVGTPAYSFISDVDTGLYRIGANDLGFTTNSTLAFELNAVQQALITNGTSAAPGLAFINDPDTGFYCVGANRFAFSVGGNFVGEFRNDGVFRFMRLYGNTYAASINNDILRLSVGGGGAVFASHLIDETNERYLIEAWKVGVGYNYPIILNALGGNIGIGKVPSYLLDLNLVTEDFAIEDAGSAGATEQDWIKVRVGGVLGYLHVFAAV